MYNFYYPHTLFWKAFLEIEPSVEKEREGRLRG